MKDEKVKKLKEELKYLLDAEIDVEIQKNKAKLEIADVDIKALAREIYNQRGLDVTKLKSGFLENLTMTITDLTNIFKDKDKNIKKKMVIDLILNILLLLLLKIPFDFVRDIGADYISAIANNQVVYNVWSLAFLLIYTLTLICTFIVLIKGFNRKYKNL